MALKTTKGSTSKLKKISQGENQRLRIRQLGEDLNFCTSGVSRMLLLMKASEGEGYLLKLSCQSAEWQVKGQS